MLIPMLAVIFIIAVGVVLLSLYFQKRLYEQQLREEALKNRHHSELLRNAIQIQEAEQKRIAQDLHDELGAALSIMRMHLVLLEQTKETLPANILKTIRDTRQLSEAAMASTRSISHRLMPPQLEAFGLLKTLEAVTEQVNRAGHLQLHLEASSGMEDLSWSMRLGLYRVAMELVNNTMKHAHATEARMHFAIGGESLTFKYTDNGLGLPETPQQGMGFKSIEARVKALDGTFHIEHHPEHKGFYALLIIPVLPNGREP